MIQRQNYGNSFFKNATQKEKNLKDCQIRIRNTMKKSDFINENETSNRANITETQQSNIDSPNSFRKRSIAISLNNIIDKKEEKESLRESQRKLLQLESAPDQNSSKTPNVSKTNLNAIREKEKSQIHSNNRSKDTFNSPQTSVVNQSGSDPSTPNQNSKSIFDLQELKDIKDIKMKEGERRGTFILQTRNLGSRKSLFLLSENQDGSAFY